MAERILFISPIWPHPGHRSAVNTISFELVREMARQSSRKLGILKLSWDGDTVPAEFDEAKAEFDRLGVEILPPLRLPAGMPAPLYRKILIGGRSDFYHQMAHEAQAHRAAMAFRPDLLFVPWTEFGTALFADMPVTKYAYYGNPDPKNLRAAARFTRSHGGSLPRYAAEMVAAHRLERVHLDVLRRYDHLSNVAANDADYYQAHGLAGCAYIQNLWIDRFPDLLPALDPSRRRPEVPVVIANIGRLNATANTFGLELLGRDILPRLAQMMEGRPYEVHLAGGGAVNPLVRPLLDRPEVRLRGFVEDIDGAMADASVFLCANNGSIYNVGHTRYLHAWSLGCCVVAYQAAGVAMPEIRHDHNALLGTDGADVARQVARALTDSGLRERIGREGYASFRRDFTAERVVPRIFKHMGL